MTADTRAQYPVDVLAVLREYAQDTGSFRVTKQGAAHLAVACAAAVELIEAAINVHAAARAGKEPDLIALADCIDAAGGKAARKAALANVDHWSRNHDR